MNDPGLSAPFDFDLARARALLDDGEPRLARQALRPALARAASPDAHLLAADVAVRLNDMPATIAHLDDAIAAAPECGVTRARLVATLLDAGCTKRAEAELAAIDDPAPALEARVHAARGRHADAVETLRAACLDETGARADEALAALIELVERSGDETQLRALLESPAPDGPAAALGAARAWLRLGEPRRAIEVAAWVADAGVAMAIRTVASAAMGRVDEAARCSDRLDDSEHRPSAALVVDLWRRSMTARALDARVGRWPRTLEPQHGPLEPLLQAALNVFEDDLTAGRRDVETERLRAVCQGALTRVRKPARRAA